MRDDKPGDLSVRLSFGRVIGNGPDSGTVRPSLRITDGTSHREIEIELTPEDLTEMMAGGEARIPAAKVNGFKALRVFGKYHKMVSRTVDALSSEQHDVDPAALPHVKAVVAEIEAMGYVCDRPRRNNARKWVIVGRRYDDQP